jgi:hypothetical protein
MDVFVSLMIIPLNAIDERKYQAQRYNAFSLPKQTCPSSIACSAVHVNWNISPGITFSEIGEIATV